MTSPSITSIRRRFRKLIRRSSVHATLPLGLLLTGCGDEFTPPEPLATSLTFLGEPGRTEGSAPISPAPQVVILDQFGNRVTDATTAVTVALTSNQQGAMLAGTTVVNALAGMATFVDLKVDRPGSDYTLTASAPGLASTTSTAFQVVLTFIQLSTGFETTCGVTVVGAAYCWGRNLFGGIGDGTVLEFPLSPVAVSGGFDFATVSAGPDHTCGITINGAAYCWGANFSGKLGDGTEESRSTPRVVSGDLTFATVSAGGDHTCGLTIDGAAYCWGYNGEGRLGDGTTVDRWAPTAVAGGLTFATVSAQQYHTCGITTAGAAYCWGGNSDGQLGDGTTIGKANPVAVTGDLTFTTLTVGTFHTCGVTTGGAAYCWGSNAYGQLGDGTTIGKAAPVAVAGGLVFAMVSAGYAHTCGLTSHDGAYCWGANRSGQLGNGSTTASSAPARAVQ